MFPNKFYTLTGISFKSILQNQRQPQTLLIISGVLAAKRRRQSRESSGVLKVASRSYHPVIYDNVRVFCRGFAHCLTKWEHVISETSPFYIVEVYSGVTSYDILQESHAARDNRFHTYWLELRCCFSVSLAATPKSADLLTQSQHPGGIFYSTSISLVKAPKCGF